MVNIRRKENVENLQFSAQRSIMIREIIGAKTMASVFRGRRNRKVMSTAMVGVIGTALSLGMAYIMRKNKKMGKI